MADFLSFEILTKYTYLHRFQNNSLILDLGKDFKVLSKGEKSAMGKESRFTLVLIQVRNTEIILHIYDALEKNSSHNSC